MNKAEKELKKWKKWKEKSEKRRAKHIKKLIKKYGYERTVVALQVFGDHYDCLKIWRNWIGIR